VTNQKNGVLRITLVRSTIGRPADQGRTVASLGLRKLNATVERPNNRSIRGMVTKIRHLVQVEELPAVNDEDDNGISPQTMKKTRSGAKRRLADGE
jgi:large subunit ribosomal protein L30